MKRMAFFRSFFRISAAFWKMSVEDRVTVFSRTTRGSCCRDPLGRVPVVQLLDTGGCAICKILTSRKLREKIKKELKALGEFENPLAHKDVKPLTGELRGFYRLTIGDYRITFSILKEEKIIAVVNLVPRGDAY